VCLKAPATEQNGFHGVALVVRRGLRKRACFITPLSLDYYVAGKDGFSAANQACRKESTVALVDVTIDWVPKC
jgi:PleD family two-component response regulator